MDFLVQSQPNRPRQASFWRGRHRPSASSTAAADSNLHCDLQQEPHRPRSVAEWDGHYRPPAAASTFRYPASDLDTERQPCADDPSRNPSIQPVRLAQSNLLCSSSSDMDRLSTTSTSLGKIAFPSANRIGQTQLNPIGPRPSPLGSTGRSPIFRSLDRRPIGLFLEHHSSQRSPIPSLSPGS